MKEPFLGWIAGEKGRAEKGPQKGHFGPKQGRFRPLSARGDGLGVNPSGGEGDLAGCGENHRMFWMAEGRGRGYPIRWSRTNALPGPIVPRTLALRATATPFQWHPAPEPVVLRTPGTSSRGHPSSCRVAGGTRARETFECGSYTRFLEIRGTTRCWGRRRHPFVAFQASSQGMQLQCCQHRRSGQAEGEPQLRSCGHHSQPVTD